MNAEVTMTDGEEQEQTPLLVVDDDPDILRIVKFFLTKQDYIVYTACNGQEAWDCLQEHTEVELVLSDLMMPIINGLDLLKLIRKDERFSELPFILVSAEGETSQKVAGLNLGADDFITKPFNFDELMARVRNHLRLRRLQRQLVIANDLLQEQNDVLLNDLETARGVQQAMLPAEFPTNKIFQIAGRYIPVEKLGGDLFDIVFLDDGKKLGVLIVDVVGHGVAAALVTAMTKVSFRNACFQSLEPAEVLARMNRELCVTLHTGYVTVFYAVLDTETLNLSYASGGHPSLLVQRRATEEMLYLDGQATFLGFFDDVEFSSDQISLQSGDRVIFYTDGIFESQDPSDQPYGMERFQAYLEGNGDKEVPLLLDGLLDDMNNFTKNRKLDDDITLVGLDIL